MNSFQKNFILVLNPFKSDIEQQLIPYLENEVNIPYVCASNTQMISSMNLEKIGLTFFILDNSIENEVIYNEVSGILTQLCFMPIIGIVASNTSFSNVQKTYKFLWNFITQPFTPRDIFLNVHRYLTEYKKLHLEQTFNSIRKIAAFDILKGESEIMLDIKEKILQIKPYDISVLLTGESGTGKELCAKLIHFLSSRTNCPFIPVNCSAIPNDLFENELFGHKKGAYTSADESEAGLIAAANKGTLFLDEIESLSEAVQGKLLRFLEDKKYKPLGQSSYLSSDIRIISAAKENLWNLVEKKKFREDLYYRLNILNIYLPPLRDRKEDIPVLVNEFITKYQLMYDKTIKGITSSGLLKIQYHSWPGNIRELENIIQQAVIINKSGWIEAQDLNILQESKYVELTGNSFQSYKKKVIEVCEKSYLQNVLTIFKGNITRAALYAEQDRRAFSRLLKKYNIVPNSFRKI